MNILRILRERAKAFDCTVCGTNHARSEIRLIGRMEKAWIVRVTCSSCSTAFKLLVLEQQETASISPVKEERPRDRRKPPMTADDVLDAHEKLREFRGDVSALFKRAAAKREAKRV